MGGHRVRSRLSLAVFAAWSLAAARAKGQDQALPEGAPTGEPPERVAHVKVTPGTGEGRPFQMGLEYTQYLREEGGLAFPGQAARAVGLRFVFREGRSIRQHFAIAHQWERNGQTVRQGFRFDLLALGFPIPVWQGDVQVEVEPILRPVRGQILFEGDGRGSTRSLLRFESGFAIGLRLAKGVWFFSLEPLSVDFRTIVATRDSTQAGFSRIWSMAATVGREF
jgi:hypothetical protein